MKKVWLILTVSLLVIVPSVLTIKVNFASQETDNSAPQNAERNRELLEIWKDHVKTLTKERNAAYKELEVLKAGGPGMHSPTMAQFGGMETQALPSPAAAQQIAGLQQEVTRLQASLEQQQAQSSASSSNREFQAQFSAMQTQMQQVRKELEETRFEKDRLIQEKEKALSQVDRMKDELANVQIVPAPAGVSGQDQEITDNLQKALNIQKKRYEDLQVQYANLESEMDSLQSTKGSDNPGEIRELQTQVADSGNALRQARELQYENETLNARIEKLQAVEKELTSTRGYFTPLIKELQTSNQSLSSENESLRAELARDKAAVDGAARQVEQFSSQNQQLSSELQSLKAEQDEMTNQLAGLKSQLQMAAADREKFKSVEEEARRLSSENKTLQQAYSELDNRSKSQEAKFREIGAQFSVLQTSNEELKSRDAERTRQIEAYRNSLRANLTDMKNLKSNFESYLESLVASFDDRQN